MDFSLGIIRRQREEGNCHTKILLQEEVFDSRVVKKKNSKSLTSTIASKQIVLGQKIQRPSILDEDVCSQLKAIAEKYLENSTVVLGNTMCADDFYEGQGRLDGAFCEYNNEEKISYLKKLKENGIVNIEMESLTFAAMCAYAGLKAGIVCVSLVDRLKNDQVTASPHLLEEWQQRILYLASMYIKEKLNDQL